MPTMFPQTLGAPDPQFSDPYAALIAAQRQKLQQPLPAMYSPEEVEQRRADNEQQYALGLLGQMSGNEQLGQVGGQVLKQALAMRQPKITERGVADQITGQFNYDPDYLRQRDEQALAGLEQRSAQARAAWDAQRAQAEERRYQQMQHDQNLAAMRSMAQAAGADAKQSAVDARKWHAEDQLRESYDRITKDFREELAATDKLRGTIRSYSASGQRLDSQAQQAVVILLQKFLDPGSVVREGEFDRTVQGQGMIQRAGNFLNRIQRGEFLTPQTIAQIDQLAGVYQAASQAKLRQNAANYSRIAEQRGLDPSAVISDPRWRSAPDAGAPASPQAIDVGATLRPGAAPAAKPQALPKSNPKGANRVVQVDW